MQKRVEKGTWLFPNTWVLTEIFREVTITMQTFSGRLETCVDVGCLASMETSSSILEGDGTMPPHETTSFPVAVG